MKRAIFISVSLSLFFISSLFCFKYWIDTYVLESSLCGHTREVRAVIMSSLDVYCYAKTDDGKIQSVDFYEPCNPGNVLYIQINDYSCSTH